MRKIKIIASAASLMLLAGCGTLASNSDVPVGVYTGVADRETVADTASVKVVDVGPAVGKGGTVVSGESCKNKIWQPAPSSENAVALMKRQAEQQGFHAVHSVNVHDDPLALAKNCWSAIVAEGIAFNPGTAR